VTGHEHNEKDFHEDHLTDGSGDEEFHKEHMCCGREIGSTLFTDTVKDEKFTMVVGVVIMANTIAMALETDNPHWKCWLYTNNLFLLFFFVEINSRIVAYGSGFWCPSSTDDKNVKDMWPWNMFDLTIVVLSVLDLWVKDILVVWLFPAEFSGDNASSMSKYVMVLRMFRILRILRALRLFKSFVQLTKLVRGILTSMQLVMWIALLMFMIMLVFAILLTDTVGMRAEEFPEQYRDDIKKYWGSTAKSLTTLFQFMTMDDWSHISHEVLTTMPYMTAVFDLYIFMQAFSMMSLLTGVIADHMVEVSQSLKETEEKDKDTDLRSVVVTAIKKSLSHTRDDLREHKHKFMEKDDKWWTNYLGSPEHPDLNGEYINSNGINRQEFEDVLTDKDNKTSWKDGGVVLKATDINEFWETLDIENHGRIDMTKMMNGVVKMRTREDNKKDLLRMRCAAEKVVRRLSPQIGLIAVKGKLEQVKTSMEDMDKQVNSLEDSLHGFLEYIRESNSFTSETEDLDISSTERD